MMNKLENYQYDLSVVIPLLNECDSLVELYERIMQSVETMGVTYELWFIDDGSTDNSWQVIRELSLTNLHVHGVRFQRNYGKSAALHTGFERVAGRVVITMDADLQDSPEEIPELYRMIIEDGWDLVSGWKEKRYDPLSKTLPTKFFNATARRVSGVKNLHDFNCGLKSYRLEVVKSIELYNDMHRYIPYLSKEAGYDKITEKSVQHHARKHGVSKYGISRFFNGYLDLMTLWFVSKFGRKPMHFFGLLGSLVFLIGLFSLAWVLISKFIALSKGVPAPLVTDRVYIYIALSAMIIGVQLFCAGFLGEILSSQNSRRNHYHLSDEL